MSDVTAQSAAAPTATTDSTVLSVESVSKEYPGTQALSGVTMSIRAGEIHALAGQNGAGKSTLIRILAGVEDADAGVIRFRGEEVRPRHDDLPVRFIHQDLGLVETMTVAENFALTVGYPRRGGVVDWGALNRRAAAALEAIGVEIDPTQAVGELATAERSMVAIARAVAVEADVVVLDEPTAALPAHDVERLFEVLKRLRERNVAMLYVTHRLDEIFRLADRVTVFRDGRVVMQGEVSEAQPDSVVEQITGRPVERLYPTFPPAGERAVVKVEDLRVDAFGPIDFEIFEGEVVALAGLRSSGHETIGRALFGAEKASAGSVQVNGKKGRRGIRGAIRDGFGFVSGRRAQEGLGPSLTVRENLYLNPSWVGAKPLRWRRSERSGAKRLVEEFGVWPADPERPILTLSGGNQQKVVVARWVQALSNVLILEEPTAGVDVGAKAELYRAIGRLLEQGRSCVLVSSDFDEVAGLAHRALVFDRGQIVKELRGDELSAESISHYASGGHRVARKGQ